MARCAFMTRTSIDQDSCQPTEVPKALMMKALPDGSCLRTDGEGSLRKDVADSEESSRNDFHNESDSTFAEHHVRQAVERRAVTGSPATIAEMLAVSAPNTYGYWVEAALELHALNQHYDALDCWRQAKTMTDHREYNARYSMGYELWNASGHGSDDYLAEEALEACVREGEWEGVACIKRAMRGSEAAVLDAMWSGLLARGQLQWDEWDIGADYCVEGYQWNEILDWESMAATVFVRGDRAKAFEAWANGLKFDPRDSDDKILRSAAAYLRIAVRDAGYSEE